MSKEKHTLRVGDVVRCPDGGEATVIRLYKDIEGGVNLDRLVGDFHSWNEEELTLIRHATPMWLRANEHLTWA